MALLSVGVGLAIGLLSGYHQHVDASAQYGSAIVQGTYICASAVMLEAHLSVLGAGTPPEISSWGNIMAEGHTYVRIAFM